jgi:alpha-tubulin suppressor-like RCC1 family protein
LNNLPRSLIALLLVACGGAVQPSEDDMANTSNRIAAESAGPPPSVSLERDEVLSANYGRTCAIRVDGAAVCWGRPEEYGENTAPPGTYRSIATGSRHTCALDTTARVRCWGANDVGQVDAPAGSFRAVAAGENHTCALRDDGSVACWGCNFGDSCGTMPPEYLHASTSPGAFVGVTAAGNFGCARRQDGSVACFGDVGAERRDPPGRFGLVRAGDWQICGLRSDGIVACWPVWGDNWIPSLPVPPEEKFVFFSVARSACGLRADASLLCWGSNDDGLTTPPKGAYRHVSVGMSHACAVRTDDSVVCWGSPDFTAVPDGLRVRGGS